MRTKAAKGNATEADTEWLNKLLERYKEFDREFAAISENVRNQADIVKAVENRDRANTEGQQKRDNAQTQADLQNTKTKVNELSEAYNKLKDAHKEYLTAVKRGEDTSENKAKIDEQKQQIELIQKELEGKKLSSELQAKVNEVTTGVTKLDNETYYQETEIGIKNLEQALRSLIRAQSEYRTAVKHKDDAGKSQRQEEINNATQ